MASGDRERARRLEGRTVLLEVLKARSGVLEGSRLDKSRSEEFNQEAIEHQRRGLLSQCQDEGRQRTRQKQIRQPINPEKSRLENVQQQSPSLGAPNWWPLRETAGAGSAANHTLRHCDSLLRCHSRLDLNTGETRDLASHKPGIIIEMRSIQIYPSITITLFPPRRLPGRSFCPIC